MKFMANVMKIKNRPIENRQFECQSIADYKKVIEKLEAQLRCQEPGAGSSELEEMKKLWSEERKAKERLQQELDQFKLQLLTSPGPKSPEVIWIIFS